MGLNARRHKLKRHSIWESESKMLRFFLMLILLSVGLTSAAQAVYFEKYGISDGLPSSEFYDLIEDKNGYLWFTSDRGVVRYNYYEFETFGIDDGLANMVNFSFHQETDSTFWINGHDGSFTFWDGTKFTPFIHNLKLKKFKQNSYEWYEINRIDEEFIWFLSVTKNSRDQHKISRLTGKIQSKSVSLLTCAPSCGFKTSRLVNYYNASKDLPLHRRPGSFYNYTFLSPKIQKIEIKRNDYLIINELLIDDNIWLLTDKGIDIRSLEFPQKRLNNYNLDAVISSAIVLSNNEVWATSLSDGIIRIPNRSVPFVLFGDNNSYKNIESIYNFFGQTYITTMDRELYKVNENKSSELIHNLMQSGIFRSYSNGENRKINFGPVQISGDSIEIGRYKEGSTIPLSAEYSIYESYKIINFVARSSTENKFLLKEPIKALVFEYHDNKAYIGTNQGLLRIDLGSSSDSKNLTIDTLLQDIRVNDISLKGNSCWVGTLGDGILHCYNNECTPIEINLKNLSIHTLHQSSENKLWIGTNKGLVFLQYNKNQQNSISIEKVSSFGTSDGLPSSYIKDIESIGDTLWVGTDKGIAKLPMKGKFKIIRSPIVHIKSVKFNNQSSSISNKQYKVPYDQNDFKIEYVAISSDKPVFPENTYRYKVTKKGSSIPNWTFTNSRAVELPNQLPGEYTFTLQSQNSSAMWSNPAFVKYEIMLHWTQTWWFRSGLLITLSLVGYLLYKRRTKLLKKRLSLELRLKNSELNVLRNQMNPHFIFNSINAVQSYIFSDMKAEANLYIHSLSKLIRKSLNFSRLETISLNQEIEYIEEYLLLEQMRFDSLFDFNITYDQNLRIDNIKIPALMIQPIVENAIKHAFKGRKSGGKISIEYIVENKTLKILISDNGIGIANKNDAVSKGHQSFGLDIVRQRLKLINEKLNTTQAQIQIDSNLRIGTKCIITLPIEKHET